MRILGHPVHMMVVHFPAALFPMEFVCSLLYFMNHEQGYSFASFYAMTGGVLVGWIAVISGAFDLVSIPADRKQPQNQAYIHALVQLIVLITYTVFLYAAWKKYPSAPQQNMLLLIAKGDCDVKHRSVI